MKFVFKIAVLIASNTLALWAATRLVGGFSITPLTASNLIQAGAMLGFVNVFIGPVVKLISLPLRILTLGLFTVIINIGLLALVAWFFDFFTINGLFAALWGIFVISLVNYAVSALFGQED